MNNSERKQLLNQIHDEIVKTIDQIKEYKQAAGPIAPENAIGRLSRMDAINNKSVLEAALRKSEEKLTALEYLVGKIDEKDFGMCARCGSEIPFPRLLFMPQSPYCVNCAS
ncbi:MAG: TraR/DksA family transcriptional regulator [Vicingaceae bacterium]